MISFSIFCGSILLWFLSSIQLLHFYQCIHIVSLLSLLNSFRGRKQYEPPRYMTINTAIEQLLEVEQMRVESGKVHFSSIQVFTFKCRFCVFVSVVCLVHYISYLSLIYHLCNRLLCPYTPHVLLQSILSCSKYEVSSFAK